jgi:hypothetical protein
MNPATRLSNHGQVPAVMSSPSTKLYFDVIDGFGFLTMEDAAFPRPTTIPWSNVASLQWVDVPAPVAKATKAAKAEAAA